MEDDLKMHFLSCGGEFNHHAKFMCDSLYKLLGENYIRLSTQNIAGEREKLGYINYDKTKYNILNTNNDIESVKKYIEWCDVLDYGAASELYLNEAIKQNKIVFIRIERLFKEGFWKILYPPVFFRYYRKYIKHRNNRNVYFLCISAYAASDLRKIGIKNERILEWGYCPYFEPLNIENISVSNKDHIDILWCGRLIEWKHPELAVEVAKRLKQINIPFKMKIIGEGKMKSSIIELIKKYDLDKNIELIGSVKSDCIRDYMKRSDIFLGTSDKNEGWGVVINEAMNSGCCVIARTEMGSVPFLINNMENGVSINSNYIEKAASKIEYFYNNPFELKRIRENAYITIKTKYNPDLYAKRFEFISKCALESKTIEIQDGLGKRVY